MECRTHARNRSGSCSLCMAVCRNAVHKQVLMGMGSLTGEETKFEGNKKKEWIVFMLGWWCDGLDGEGSEGSSWWNFRGCIEVRSSKCVCAGSPGLAATEARKVTCFINKVKSQCIFLVVSVINSSLKRWIRWENKILNLNLPRKSPSVKKKNEWVHF